MMFLSSAVLKIVGQVRVERTRFRIGPEIYGSHRNAEFTSLIYQFIQKFSHLYNICRKVIEKEITSLTYRDMVIRMVCASEECRHVNPVNLKDFRFLSEYMQQIPKGFESLPPRFSEKNH